MKEHKATFSVASMSRVLGVSRSGFYGWLKRQSKPSNRQCRQHEIDQAVKAAFNKRKGRCGSPRLVRDLVETGQVRNRKTVAKSMQRQGLRARAAKKFKATTNSKHNLPVAPNVLQQNFAASRPNEKYVGDITYLWTEEGWLYLAVVIDLYSRLVVGWAMSERMTAQLVCDALTMALWRRQMPTGVIVHTDRGSQYCSGDYQDLIKKHQLICSMSAKGNCYDNACAESFFHSLKVEIIHGHKFLTRELMRQTVFEYIEIEYNRDRRHSAIGYVSPEAYEATSFA